MLRSIHQPRSEDGSTMVALLFTVIICGALSAGIVAVNISAQREANTLLARERAFQLAEAGVDWTLAEMRKSGGALLPDAITTVNAHSTGDFVIRTQRGNTNGRDDNGDDVIDDAAEASLALIYSTGRSGGVERTLQVTLQESIEDTTVDGSIQFNVDFPIVDFRGNAFSINGNDHFVDGTVDNSRDSVWGLSSPATIAYVRDQIASNRWDQLVGLDASPSIGTVDPIDLNSIVDRAKATATVVIPDGSAQTGLSLGTPTREGVKVVYGSGDVHISGGSSGAGVLAIDGDLFITGAFEWVGVVMVRGRVTFSGGGDAKRVIGALVVGEEVQQESNSSEASISGTVDLLYSSHAIELALQSLSTMQVVTWQEVGNP